MNLQFTKAPINMAAIMPSLNMYDYVRKVSR